MHSDVSLKSDSSPPRLPAGLAPLRLDGIQLPRQTFTPDRESARRSRRPWSALTGSLQQRGVSLVFVIVLHVALVILLTDTFGHRTSLQAPAPMQVSLIEQPEVSRDTEPLPPVPLEMPRLDPLPLPDVVIDVPPAQAAITVPVQPVSSPPRDIAPGPSITPPQFDADYLSNPAPSYPPISRRLREEGLVVLRVRVSTDGQAAEVRLEQTSGFARLDSAALSAVKRWRFVPARRGQDIVEAWVLVPIEFDLKA